MRAYTKRTRTRTRTRLRITGVGESYPKRESSLFYGSSHSGISGALDSIMCVEYWETYCRRRVIGTHTFGCYQRNVISKACVELSDLLLFGVQVNLMCWEKKRTKLSTRLPCNMYSIQSTCFTYVFLSCWRTESFSELDAASHCVEWITTCCRKREHAYRNALIYAQLGNQLSDFDLNITCTHRGHYEWGTIDTTNNSICYMLHTCIDCISHCM